VILLDMKMPVMDGRAFAGAYRALPGPHAAVVVMTAADNPRNCSEAVCADGWLAKPFDVDDLLAEIRRVVR
jgi:CheY-like chemotaxis protein